MEIADLGLSRLFQSRSSDTTTRSGQAMARSVAACGYGPDKQAFFGSGPGLREINPRISRCGAAGLPDGSKQAGIVGNIPGFV